MNAPRARPVPEAVGIVGAGRAGLTLALALRQRRHPVWLWVRDSARREALLADPAIGADPGLRLDAFPQPDWAALPTVALAVPDGALLDVASDLQLRGALGPQALLFHLAGALPASHLEAALRALPSLRLAAAHPLAALPDLLTLAPGPPRRAGLRALKGATWALDGTPEALAALRRLVGKLGRHMLQLAPADRAAWHAAAAIVANDLAALLMVGEAVARAAGVEATAIRAGHLHLAHSALQALAALPTAAPLWRGLTGAVRRGDAATIGHHLEVLQQAALATPNNAPLQAAAPAHQLLSSVLVETLATAQALDAAQLRALRHALLAAASKLSGG